MREIIKNQIEFHFLGAGGSAVGPIGIAVFALLCFAVLAFMAIIIAKFGSTPLIKWIMQLRQF
ncbi:MAG: hypothetical protein J0I19_03480 [Alphaproteobacteria bacterium]|nr:hypothetical protein [Alphaproteobacteria bacterium]